MGRKPKIARRHHELPMPYYVHTIFALKEQTDCGAAISGTAFLDLLLRMTIERLMRGEQEIQDLIFENRGALQDFGARIQVAYALQLIGYTAYHDLGILKDIRNAFAHSAEIITFDTTDVASLCDGLWYSHKVRMVDHPNPKTPREFFMRELEWLADALLEHEDAPRTALPMGKDFILWGPERPHSKPPTSPKKPRPLLRLVDPTTSQKT